MNATLEKVAFRAELWRKFVTGYLRTSWSALVGCAEHSITPRTLPPVHPGWASAYCGVCGKRYDAVDKLTAVRILNLCFTWKVWVTTGRRQADTKMKVFSRWQWIPGTRHVVSA